MQNCSYSKFQLDVTALILETNYPIFYSDLSQHSFFNACQNSFQKFCDFILLNPPCNNRWINFRVDIDNLCTSTHSAKRRFWNSRKYAGLEVVQPPKIPIKRSKRTGRYAFCSPFSEVFRYRSIDLCFALIDQHVHDLKCLSKDIHSSAHRSIRIVFYPVNIYPRIWIPCYCQVCVTPKGSIILSFRISGKGRSNVIISAKEKLVDPHVIIFPIGSLLLQYPFASFFLKMVQMSLYISIVVNPIWLIPKNSLSFHSSTATSAPK